ncbi:TIR domain-containing protein [Sorangium sp. So ce296]|uniref:toll/interleukin-1 receptor domain-containing protein n=1 Tax=Sorangium sp. So ce296 TaxID=3133296 RepID=UPI003F635DB8
MSSVVTPKVFVSHSWSSEEHKQRVLDLATMLRDNGVDIILDRWDLKEGHDVHRFMEQMVTDSAVTKVLVVCDKLYASKANNRSGGVGTETQIISPEIYGKVEQSKFIPLVAERDGGEACLPAFLKSRKYIDISTPESFHGNLETIIRTIFEKPLDRKPPLGEPPAYLLEEEPTRSRTASRLIQIKDAVSRGRQARGLTREYLRLFSQDLADATAYECPPELPIDERILVCIDRFLPRRDEFVELVRYLALHVPGDELQEELFDFFGDLLGREGPREAYQSEVERFLAYELFLYATAVLIREKLYDQARGLMSSAYYHRKYEELVSFSKFRPYLDNLERHRNARLKQSRISIMADLVKERARPEVVAFSDIQQADFVLALYSILRCDSLWVPVTLIYAAHYESMKLFVLAESTKHFLVVLRLLGVATSDEFRQLLEGGYQRHRLNGEFSFGSGSTVVSISRLANLSKLATRP